MGRSQGLEVLIRATQRARQRGVDVRTRIVGHGADVRRLVALNEALGSPVELLPHVAADEVFGHYTWADTTVVSLRDWEPFQWTVPSKLYELMATGKHVTAAVAGEAAELVRQSCSGDVVAPGDVEGIAELWVQLAADRARVASRDGGRSWVAANVDYDVIAKRYLQVIQEALANFTAARHPRS
ncbi:glycosyltransferase [Agrococcus sp. KRD186]|uniref:glycosyltransferase n=1 Tax=Agrococcus sp. KRD186 TaxID=2729730 RepID=UPI0031453FB8